MHQHTYTYRLFLTVTENGEKHLLKADIAFPVEQQIGYKVMVLGMGLLHTIKEVRTIQSVDRDGKPSASEDFLVEMDLDLPEGTWEVTDTEIKRLQNSGWTICKPPYE